MVANRDVHSLQIHSIRLFRKRKTKVKEYRIKENLPYAKQFETKNPNAHTLFDILCYIIWTTLIPCCMAYVRRNGTGICVYLTQSLLFHLATVLIRWSLQLLQDVHIIDSNGESYSSLLIRHPPSPALPPQPPTYPPYYLQAYNLRVTKKCERPKSYLQER